MATTKEVFPSDAILWLEFGGQYVNGAGKTVIDNLATMGNAVKTVMCGDGTTANTIPAQIAGKRGLYFDGNSNYLDTGIIDPFDRTDKFTMFFVAACNYPEAIEMYAANADQAGSPIIGIHFFQYLKKMYVEIISSPSSQIKLSQTTGASRNVISQCFTYNGSSLASGILVYTGGVLTTNTVTSNNLTTTIKNGKSLLIGTKYDGALRPNKFSGNMHFAAIFPLALSQLQVSNLHKKVIKRINLP